MNACNHPPFYQCISYGETEVKIVDECNYSDVCILYEENIIFAMSFISRFDV